MRIDFAPSERSTVGLEWEVFLTDASSGELVCEADAILAELPSQHTDDSAHITHEFLANTLELVSGISHTVDEAVADLSAQLDALRRITDPQGIEVVCAGTHPFTPSDTQHVTPKERYERLIERTQWWGRNQMIWGNHVHVGVEDAGKVLPLLGGLLRFLPHIQALGASSPFWLGTATGYASNRTLIFQQLPTAGLPWPFTQWSEYENYIADMTRSGAIQDQSEIRWDIRPSPRWGTLEMRACDGLSTIEEVGAIAALVHCLVDDLSRQLDDRNELAPLQPWISRENKWRAARYGLDADVIVDASGRQRPLRDDLVTLIDRLEPTARRLGCEKELGYVNEILRLGASYERQRAVAATNNGHLTAVVHALARELRQGLFAATATNRVA